MVGNIIPNENGIVLTYDIQKSDFEYKSSVDAYTSPIRVSDDVKSKIFDAKIVTVSFFGINVDSRYEYYQTLTPIVLNEDALRDMKNSTSFYAKAYPVTAKAMEGGLAYDTADIGRIAILLNLTTTAYTNLSSSAYFRVYISIN